MSEEWPETALMTPVLG